MGDREDRMQEPVRHLAHALEAIRFDRVIQEATETAIAQVDRLIRDKLVELEG
jgi:hypothetical protein